MSILRRFLLRLLSFFRPHRAERDLQREIASHLQLLEQDFVARGLSPDEARYAARRAFGGVEQAKERQRDARSFRWLEGASLDIKLGLRMLLKNPGLTLVGGAGMAVGIAVGAVSFAFLFGSLHPTLPLEDGERIVGIENWDTRWSDQEPHSIHDFAAWRTQLTSVQDLAAFQPSQRNLLAADGRPLPVAVAEMTASGFRVARVNPQLGRYLRDDDEQETAPPVIVLGHDVWRTRFSSDPSVVGRTVRLANTLHTVVGVMPAGFAFPVNQDVWIPLRVRLSDFARREGPEITMFARLASGATIESAQAQLAALGLQARAAFPATHERLQPRTVRYTELWFDDEPRAALPAVQFAVTLLLVVIAVNVAVLVYARTAGRQPEIVVRLALGASRQRIIGQLFLEALVLSVVSAAAGLVLTDVTLSHAHAAAERFGAAFGGLPFWMRFELSAGTLAYIVGTALLAAAIIGIVPALRATRKPPALAQLTNHAGLTLGGTWTVLVVLQVAVAVAVLPGAVYLATESIRLAGQGPGFPADDFLAARVVMDEQPPSRGRAEQHDREFAVAYGLRVTELAERLSADAAVAAVAMASTEPGMGGGTRVELDPSRPLGRAVGDVAVSHVDARYFDTFGIHILGGPRRARLHRRRPATGGHRGHRQQRVRHGVLRRRCAGPGHPPPSACHTRRADRRRGAEVRGRRRGLRFPARRRPGGRRATAALPTARARPVATGAALRPAAHHRSGGLCRPASRGRGGG